MNQGKKLTGGKYHSSRKKKLYEKQNQRKHPSLGKTSLKTVRVKGGNTKTFVLKTNIANIIVDGKAKKADIINVEETPQNRFFARQNLLYKGALIETSLGKARITNRPTKEGCVNAILIK